MKQLFTLLIAMLLPLTTSSQSIKEPSKYVYGCYGLQSYPHKDDYQKYVGKVFTFLPATPMLEEEEWLEFVGEPGGKYEIVKITTNDEGTNEMDVYVYYKDYEANSNKKARVRRCKIKNYNSMTSIWQTPFIFMDDINTDLKESIGKVFTRSDAENTYEILDAKFEKFHKDSTHCSIVYNIKDSYSGINFRAECMGRRCENLGDFLFQQNNKSTLVRVEQPKKNADRYGEIKMVELKDTMAYEFSDSIVDIVLQPYKDKKLLYPWSKLSDYRILRLDTTEISKIYQTSLVSPNSFLFRLKNKSDKTIKVIWDEAVFVGIDGETSGLIHTGTKFMKKEDSQIPSTIIRGAALTDILLPKENVKLEEWPTPWTYLSVDSKWVAYPLYNNTEPIQNPLSLRVMLPIQINDVINDYVFEFEVKATYSFPFTVLKK